MSSAKSLFEAFFIWCIMIIVSITLLFAVAMPWDNILVGFQNAGVENVGEQWNTFGDRDFLGTLIMVIIYVLPIIGGVNFIATAVRRQEYDSESVYQQQTVYR